MKYLLFLLFAIPNFTLAQSTENHLKAPFYHGVASGDPLAEAVIIWTRVAPINVKNNRIIGKWFVTTDSEMKISFNLAIFRPMKRKITP
ncbi:MAG: hypothetical protein HC803_00420 [Saprospiraceae bacterium]|nr:hypothetical protein [Saprospiraceae bacterium]